MILEEDQSKIQLFKIKDLHLNKNMNKHHQ